MRSGRQLTRRAAVGALALVAVVGLVATTPAVAAYEEDKPGWSDDPRAGSNASAEIMAAQLPLVDAAQRLTDLEPKFPGLGGLRLRVEDRTLEVWWKGEVPAEIREEIARQESELGIRVALGESAYTQRELVEAAAVVPERPEAYPGLVRVGPLPDGSGLEVATTDPKAAMKYEFAVATTIVRAEEGGIQQLSRANDSPPWWGGAQIRGAFPGAGSCSTGFAIKRMTLWWESWRGILTAEHCMFGGGMDFTDPTGQVVGRAEPAPARRLSDSLAIQTNSGARIYDGGVGVGEFSKPVIGAVGNFPGLFVCTTGAFTGVHCNVRTDRINQLVMLTPSFLHVQSVSLGTQINGRAAAGSGDSGGPVFALTGDFSKTFAAGTIIGGLNPVACDGFGSGCLNTVAWVDISWVLIVQQAQLATS
ncbi:hypothetical protein [Catellatospora sp. NPDC049609]|uniref:hypothetical protein n=1 Tax=Catellatospora sp. NPDC049609 TaxID=3155505 RepID=UPI00343C5A02